MSYARLAEHSDVYLYPDVAGGVTCCWCALNRGETARLLTIADTVAHLRQHEEAGHRCGVTHTTHRNRQPTVRLRTWADLVTDIATCDDVIWPDTTKGE